jgi:hypothetical protein
MGDKSLLFRGVLSQLLRLVLVRLVASSLELGEVESFFGMGSLVPELFAAGGNLSYQEFLGHNRWPAVPRVNYPDIYTSLS